MFREHCWSWGCVSAIDSNGRKIWIADAHRDTVMRYVVHAPAPENAATPQRRRRRKPRRGSNVKFVLSWRRKTGTQEENGALIAPCSIHGQPARLLVDTGSFVTIFTEPVLKSLGVGLQPTHISARFPTCTSRKVSAAQINDLKIGDFKVRPGKFGVTPSPNFAPRQGAAECLDSRDGHAVQLSCHHRSRWHESLFEIAR